MKLPLFTVLMLSVSAAFAAEERSAVIVTEVPPGAVSAQVEPAKELLRMSLDMWFVLSGVYDKRSADEAAPQFRKLMDAAVALSEKVYSESAAEIESESETHRRLDESLEELTEEFVGLCGNRCFGSEKLLTEFRYSVEIGLMGDDCSPLLEEPRPHLSENEAKRELLRMKNLVLPDKDVLIILQSVNDAASAKTAATRLHGITERLNSLVPETAVAERDFAPKAGARARKAYAPIEPLLWGIRTEIVRIASLPGYHKTDFDSFSEALESVFRSLAETHYHFFDEVFDDSFHSDLDEALRENATTSN